MSREGHGVFGGKGEETASDAIRVRPWYRQCSVSVVPPEVVRKASVALVCAVVGSSMPVRGAVAAPPESVSSSSPEDTVGGQQPAPGATASDEAQPDAKRQAQRLADDGRQLFWKGEYEAAIEAFQSAYEVFPDPNLLFNISAAHEKRGDYDGALAYLDRYEAAAPPSEAASISARRSELQRARDAASEGAPARGDGEGDPTDPAPQSGATAGTGPEGPPTQAGPDLPEPTPYRVMSPMAWSLLGVTAVASGVGIGFGVSARGLSGRADADCASNQGKLRCPVGAQDDLDTAKRHALAADIAFGAAAVAGVAALVLIGIRARRREKAPQRMSVRPGASGVALSF